MSHRVVKNILATAILSVMFPAFVMIVGPEFPAPKESLVRSDEAASLAATTLSNALRGHTVRVDRRFGDNLNLYLSKNAFELMPDPARDEVVRKVGKSWCNNADYPWLPRVAIYDIATGTRLAAHHCVFEELGEMLPSSFWNS